MLPNRSKVERKPDSRLRAVAKRFGWLLGGCCWLGFAATFGLFLYGYLTGGAGLQAFGFHFGISSGTVLIGLVHFVGLSFLTFTCFAIGAGFCARAWVGPAPRASVW